MGEARGARVAKTITFGVPCYNSAAYMDRCISSIVEGSAGADDVQVVVVDDGSTKDDTLAKAREWEARCPGIVKAVHQDNGGHGMAVLKALEEADGTYFKIVDSDDWVDGAALRELLAQLRRFVAYETRVDLVVTNYVYEHVDDGKQNTVDFGFALPKGKVITWDKIGHFSMFQNMLMHALCYRTDVLRDGGIPMPAHTFYVDNIYAYVPLPRCRTLYYLDVDLYRYFIGREDQSVNEKVMISRIDQQLRVTRVMMRSYHLFDDITSIKLRYYMLGHFTLMMAASSIYSQLAARQTGSEEAMDDMQALWDELREFDERMYRYVRTNPVGFWMSMPGRRGGRTSRIIYRCAQWIVKFN